MSLELKYNIMVLAVRRLINRVKMKDERKSNEMKKKEMCLHGQLMYGLYPRKYY